MTPVQMLKQMCRPHWDAMLAREPVSRVWRRDHTLWRSEPHDILNRLGWLDLPFTMKDVPAELAAFVAEVRQDGFRDVVLLGMGGSSLGAEVMRQTLGEAPGFPRLHVLDSTIPAAVDYVTRRIDPARALFLVSSKSGGTVEVLSLYRHFRALVEKIRGGQAGRNFIAITDPGTSLEKLAADGGFRRAFINPPDIGGRFSALSYFGLVPAALIGADTAALLARATEVTRACGVEVPLEDNPGGWLGAVMGCLALSGRNKLTLVASSSFASFGLWAEQLIAESTGKEGKGIIPIAEEPFGPVESYGPDRFFVYLRCREDDNSTPDAHMELVQHMGHPVLQLDVRDRLALGAEFFRWEFATAIAGACLAINPFDQPNVEAAKINARRLLQQFEQTGKAEPLQPEGDPVALLKSAKPEDYVAIMAFVNETPEVKGALQQLRRRLLTGGQLATTLGFGPRFLHSTGQLHKGGPANGVFLQITADPDRDLPIPGAPYTFGILAAGQAQGDLEALCAAGRRYARIHLRPGERLPDRIAELTERIL